MREAAPDGRGAHQRLAQGGRGPAQRDGQLHQFAALDPRCAARQRELHLLSALQAARPRHRQVPPAHDPGHETPGRAARGLGDRHRPPLPAGVTLRGVPDAGCRMRGAGYWGRAAGGCRCAAGVRICARR